MDQFDGPDFKYAGVIGGMVRTPATSYGAFIGMFAEYKRFFWDQKERKYVVMTRKTVNGT